MKKTFEFALPQVPYFEQPRNDFLPKLCDANITYYENGTVQLIEEYIDYHQAILYRIQSVVTDTCSIPITTKRSDYHLLYPVQVAETITLESAEPISKISLSNRLATYTYIPKCDLMVTIHPGTYLVYGLLIDIGLIREVLYNEDHFLSDFRRARSRNKKLLYQSSAWPIKEKTLYQLEYIETVLFTFRKEHEGKVVEVIYNLFDIAVEKQFTTYEKLSEGEELAKRAKKRIEVAIGRIFSEAGTRPIAVSLHVTVKYLGEVYKQYYGITLVQYRNQLILEKAKRLIQAGNMINEVSNYCGFSHPSSFTRFFIRHQGMHPSKYRQLYGGNGPP